MEEVFDDMVECYVLKDLFVVVMDVKIGEIFVYS